MERTQSEIELFKMLYPVTKAISYGNGCYKIIRTAERKPQTKPPIRNGVIEMTKNSLLRLMFIMQCTKVEFKTMLTLTYPSKYPLDGRIVKSDINVMAQKMRRRSWSYLWFLEFQKRGAPHMHFLIAVDSISPRMRVDVGLFWTSRIANSDWFVSKCRPEEYTKEVLKMAQVNCHEKTMELIRLPDGATRYVTKYAAKEKQKAVPKMFRNVGRFWGASRDVHPSGIEFDVTEDEIEKWLVEKGHPASSYHLVPKFIWGVETANGQEATAVDTSVPLGLTK